MNTVQSEMQETGEGNVPSPSPSAPPRGGDSPIDTVQLSASTHPVSGENLPANSTPLPMCTAIQGQSPDTARPLSRGREEAA